MKNNNRPKLHFRRLEFKYVLTPEQHKKIQTQIRAFMIPDPYAKNKGAYTVSSLYFDSPGLRYYYENEAGLKTRQKIRHRWYNHDNSKIFWEIKRKKDAVVIKDRCLASKPTKSIKQQLDFYTLRHRLRPVLSVHYQRQPWIIPGRRFRFTFDYDLFADDKELLPEKVIMELKFTGKLPFWTHRLIQQHSLERQAMGKYRLAVEKTNLVK